MVILTALEIREPAKNGTGGALMPALHMDEKLFNWKRKRKRVMHKRSGLSSQWCAVQRWACILTAVAGFTASETNLVAREKIFDFLGTPTGSTPPGWRSEVGGSSNQPGQWQVVIDTIPSISGSLDPLASGERMVQSPVLAQTGRVTVNEHFPMLVYEDAFCRDFTMSLKFKIVEGNVDAMAGICFRFVDPKNYYVIRASSKDATLRFYKYFQGLRDEPIGPQVEIPRGEWMDLRVKADGPRFQAWLNGKKAFDEPVVDYSFDKGLVGIWTKSDSVSHFGAIRLDYTPLRTMAEVLVDMAQRKFEDLEEISLYAAVKGSERIQVIASSAPTLVGLAATDVERDVLEKKHTYRARERDRTTIMTVPLEDRNGDAVAALRIVYKGFRGETETTSLIKARGVADWMTGNLGLADLMDR
jgi:hypothetical protein